MITQVLHCPYCQGIDLVKNGKTPQGKQRYQCREKSNKRGMKNKQFLAAMDNEYLTKVLAAA